VPIGTSWQLGSPLLLARSTACHHLQGGDGNILFHLNLFFAFTQEEIENANGFGGSCRARSLPGPPAPAAIPLQRHGGDGNILFHLNLFFAFTQEEIENANGFGGSCRAQSRPGPPAPAAIPLQRHHQKLSHG
jgi:hypothetical protein